MLRLVQRGHPKGWAGGQVGGVGVWQLAGCVAQGGAQAFFQRGVVERHAQKIMHGQLLLHSQGQGERLVNELGRGAQLRVMRGVPARVIPLALWHTASLGLEVWLSAVS